MQRMTAILISSVLLITGCTKTLIATGWSSKELAEVIGCEGVRYSAPSIIYFNSNARTLTEDEIKSYSIHVFDKLKESSDKEICPNISVNGIEQSFKSFIQNRCNYTLIDYSALGDEIKFEIDVKSCSKKSYQLRKYRSEEKASFFPT